MRTVHSRNALDPQRPRLLEKIEQLILQMQEKKSAEERRIQDKIKHLGRCPMDYEWIKEEGGYRCAGGSHYLSDAELAEKN